MMFESQPTFIVKEEPGMTYRKWLIGQLLTGALSRSTVYSETEIVKAAVRMADAVIAKERDTETNQCNA